jgi:hypothetical protein
VDLTSPTPGPGPLSPVGGEDDRDPLAGSAVAGGPTRARRDPVAQLELERTIRWVVDASVVVLCGLFVFVSLHPGDILSSAVPAGGDMGAHVWGPAYLRDHLLPDLRLAGWTPDWYAGFPAYQFYMVVPSLMIVALDVGIVAGWAALLVLAVTAAVATAAVRSAGSRRWWLVALAIAIVVLGVDLPYGTAFKLVTISGLVTLPAAAYALGRLADVPFPGPVLMAVGTLPFLFNRDFTIYGGNVASTLAGEFAFSISLSLALVYLGVVIRGLRTGRHRALAAVLLALTGLCHIIPAFFVLGATVVVALAHRRRQTVTWLAGVLPVGGLLSAFWVLPFVWQRAYVNDMGWEKLPYALESNARGALGQTLFTLDGLAPGREPAETFWRYLVPTTGPLPEGVPGSPYPDDMRWVLALAIVGLGLAVASRIRLGPILAWCALGSAVAFVVIPEGRLWNARVLPFYYLCLYLLAALAIAELGRTLSRLVAAEPDRDSVVGSAATAVAAAVVAAVLVALPLGTLPFGSDTDRGGYRWFGFEVSERSFVRSWAAWNYSGYEAKDAYPEYHDLVRTMEVVGEERGCGRAFWEYERDLNRYGTPMALMLLPHWTDGCIGSMEGLFFESSATTPFHFLVQSQLSAAPSSAQRDLPYRGFDIDAGIRDLQLMGVRYYLATSVQATTAAREHDDLTELTTSGPWAVFEVADSEVVEPLDHQPAVLDGVDHGQLEWVCGEEDEDGRCAGPAVRWFQADDRSVLFASDGPATWQRIDPGDPAPEPDRRAVPATTVSDLEVGRDTISFTVSDPGRPVLVKASYFPAWQVSGAEGPYRVAPNLMVVVPTGTEVRLSYGRTPVEWAAYGLTAVGLALLALLVTRPPLEVPGPVAAPVRRRRLIRDPDRPDAGPGPGGGPDRERPPPP